MSLESCFFDSQCVSTPWVKKQDTNLLAITSLTIIRFSKFFTTRLGSKFATNSCSNIAPRFKHVAIAVTVWPQFRNANFWDPILHFGRRGGGRSGSTIVPFDRVMVCSYRLSIATISLSLMAAICNANSRAHNPIRGKGEGVGCQRWCYSISNCRFVRKNRKPKPISRYFEKPKLIPTFEKPTKKPIPTQL